MRIKCAWWRWHTANEHNERPKMTTSFHCFFFISNRKWLCDNDRHHHHSHSNIFFFHHIAGFYSNWWTKPTKKKILSVGDTSALYSATNGHSHDLIKVKTDGMNDSILPYMRASHEEQINQSEWIEHCCCKWFDYMDRWWDMMMWWGQLSHRCQWPYTLILASIE